MNDDLTAIERSLYRKVLGYLGEPFCVAREDWLKSNGEPVIGGGTRFVSITESPNDRSAVFKAANVGSADQFVLQVEVSP